MLLKICSEKIEFLLAAQLMRKSELANLCGICRQSLSLILKRGTCEPRTAGKIAAGLGVSVSDIADEEV